MPPKARARFYIRPGLPPPAFINGGGQESNYRSGTENMPGICGFGAACAGTDAKADIARMTQLRDLAREKLAQIDGLVLIGSQAAPHIVNLSLPGLRSQGIINCLQSDGIYVSAGSACSKATGAMCLRPCTCPPPSSTAPFASRSPATTRKPTLTRSVRRSCTQSRR